MAANARAGARGGALPWWSLNVTFIVVLSVFVIYSFWAATFGRYDYEWGPYLSPFFSPFINIPALSWLSPALLVIWVPTGFRASCYYYREEVYRAFMGDPAGCARREYAKRPRYTGESRGIFSLVHLHRYFLYLSIIVWGFLMYDGIRAFFFRDPAGALHFGIGLGSIILLLNGVFIGLYTFSCHAFRHFVGGSVDCFDCVLAGGTRKSAWRRVSLLNHYHGAFAWLSMIWIGFADLYVRLLATGVLHDPRLF